MKRNPFKIGEGDYLILYKRPNSEKIYNFTGECENFAPSADSLSAFWNKEEEKMLLIRYSDIVGLFPVE